MVPLPSVAACFGRAAQVVDGADDGAVGRVDRSGVRLAVAQNVDAVVERVVEIAVRVSLHLDGLDGGQRLGVEHHHRVAAGEPVMGFRRNRRAVHSEGVGNLAHLLQSVQVEHRHPSGIRAASDIQPAAGRVRSHVVKAAIATYFGGLLHFVRAILGQTDGGYHRECQAKLSHQSSPSNTVGAISFWKAT